MYRYFFPKIINKLSFFSKVKFTIKGLSINVKTDLFKLLEIYPTDTFYFPQVKDLTGKTNENFNSYSCQIPSQYILCIPKGKCILGKEEVFTRNNRVIKEITSQKNNPLLGSMLQLYPTKRIKGSVVNLSLSGLEKNYYHFTTELLLRFHLLRKANINPDFYIVDNSLVFQKELLKLLKIPEHKILTIDSSYQVIQATTLYTTSLINNWEYCYFNNVIHYQKQWLPKWNKDLYEDLKKINTSLIKNYNSPNIYISRNHGTKRTIENEEELLFILKSYNFKILYLEELSILEQISYFAHAKIIIAPHGAGLVNLNYCKKGTVILELFPQFYHDASFKLLAFQNSLIYNYVICKTSFPTKNPTEDNINVDINQLKKFLINYGG